MFVSCHGEEYVHEKIGEGDSGTTERIFYCSVCGREWVARQGYIREWEFDGDNIFVVDDTGYRVIITPEEMNRIASGWMNHRRAIKVEGVSESTPKRIVLNDRR